MKIDKEFIVDFRKCSNKNLKVEKKILKLFLKIIKGYEDKNFIEDKKDIYKLINILETDFKVISNSYTDILFIPKEYIEKRNSIPFTVCKFRCKKNSKYYKIVFSIENTKKRFFMTSIEKADFDFTEEQILRDLFCMDLFKLKEKNIV